MSLTYYKFLFFNTIKRKSVWITWLLYLLIAILFIIVLPVASTIGPYYLWANSSMPICETFMGIVIAVFSAILAINVFKTSNEEGTELVIVSKPISRTKSIVCKFLIFFTFCILVNLTAVLVSIFTIFIPGVETKFYWGMVVSMFIGNLVTFGIFGAISILLSVRFAKAGIIIGNLIVILVMFVYQLLTSFVLSDTVTTITAISNSTVTVQSHTVAIRNADGTYKERHYAGFVPTKNSSGEYDLKATSWKDTYDYWTNKNSKDGHTAIMATDFGSQLALTYMTAGLNKYDRRQAERMYNFSRYYDYELTGPASPEYYQNDSELKFVYLWSTDYLKFSDYSLYMPSGVIYPGVRSTKATYIKGTMDDRVPVAELKGNGLLNREDVHFEPEQWQKYGPIFDKMYDKLFNYDIKNGSGEYIYEQNSNYIKTFDTNGIWFEVGQNFKKFYQLVWACLTGNHSKEEFFGDSADNPCIGKTQQDFDINSVRDLNERYLQFQHYCFYKVYDEQHDLMINGSKDPYEIEGDEALGTPSIHHAVRTAIQKIVDDNNLGTVQTGDGIGDNGLVMRATPDSNSSIVMPGTQTINLTLIYYIRPTLQKYYEAKGLKDTSPEWINSSINGSYAKYKRTTYIANWLCSDSAYLYNSLESPDRNTDYTSQPYIVWDTYIPYFLNIAGVDQGEYYPYGQNLLLSWYECKPRIHYGYFVLIWGLIATAGYAAGAFVYSRYDIK